MSETRPPFMFWAIAVVGVLWNFIGCWNYILQTNPEAVAQMPEVYRFVVENRPSWATAAFAISVYGGAVGCILMLLRRRVALALLIISLLGSIMIFYFSFRVLGIEPATASALLMSIGLVWFAQLAMRKGWLA
ncbi:MAG: hypothetical protein MK180_14345 [Rhodobacteraceae bacterium]|nr:hypothetical protein [Paracoccaceae bacterium]